MVYHVLDSDYGRYMDAQQAINLALVVAFEEREIDFAFPTRTLHVETAPDPRVARPAESSDGAGPASPSP